MDIGRYRNNQNWNIGFCKISPSDLIRTQRLPVVHWLKHGYSDRFFADPFILWNDTDTIHVLVEEMEFHAKGVISLLIVDAFSYELLDRKVLLNHDTHLSYPAIIRDNGKIYVYPENYSAGHLSLYELDEKDYSLKPVSCLLDESLTDATVFLAHDGRLYMISTLSSNSRDNAFLFASDSIKDGFTRVFADPVVTGHDRSRCGGNFFKVKKTIYRPAQNCSNRYGGSIKIMEVQECSTRGYSEKEVFELKPNSWRYNLGMHTLNFSHDHSLAVVDGYGFQYPFVGRVLDWVSRFYHKVKGLGMSLP